MSKRLFAAAALAAAVVASPAAAAPLPFQVLNGADFQGFLTNQGDAPYCVAIASEREWERVVHPAAVMNTNRPFAPPASLWRTHTVLLLARSINGDGAGDILRMQRVDQRGGQIQVRTRFTPPPRASYQGQVWTAVAVARPLTARNVSFMEGSRTICSLRLTPAQRTTPPRARGRR